MKFQPGDKVVVPRFAGMINVTCTVAEVLGCVSIGSSKPRNLLRLMHPMLGELTMPANHVVRVPS